MTAMLEELNLPQLEQIRKEEKKALPYLQASTGTDQNRRKSSAVEIAQTGVCFYVIKDFIEAFLDKKKTLK